MPLPSEKHDSSAKPSAPSMTPRSGSLWRWPGKIQWPRCVKPKSAPRANLVRGCVSRVWLAAEWRPGIAISVDADSPLVRGLVALLCGIYDGASPAEVITEEPIVLNDLGILRNLSPTRQSGLTAVRRALTDFAANHS